MIEKIVRVIRSRFPTIGGTVTAQFATGVDVAEVVKVVLRKSGHAKLLAACETAAEYLGKLTQTNGLEAYSELKDAIEAAEGCDEKLPK